MARNTSVTLGEHFSAFVTDKIAAGRYDNVSEAVRAGLRLLEEREAKLDVLRQTLEAGEQQLDQGQGTDGDTFMNKLIG